MSFFTPFLLGQLANLFTAQAGVTAFAAIFVALIAVAAVGALWQVARSLAMLRIRARGTAIASGALWERAIREPASWHNAIPLGDRIAQATAVGGASGALNDATIARLLDTAIIIGSLAAVATTNGALLASVLVLITVQISVAVVLIRLSSRKATERIDAAAATNGRLIEIMRAVNRIRVAGAESRVFLKWSQLQARYAQADQGLRRLSMYQGLITSIWPVVGLIVIVLVTAASKASFGQFLTAQTATAIAGTAVAAASFASASALVARRYMAKAKPLLASEPESGADGIPPGVISGGIETRDLVFRYAPGLAPVLNEVSISVRPGEQLAVVGPSGCGKSTLMRVILGLEEPESGVILVDNKDLASLNRPAVRRQIGSVLQSSQLLPGPIRANVDMGRGLTTSEIWEALYAASVGDDVKAMPMGLDTPVSDGAGTISGGQRQRILIARALAGNPRMLFLDEATSALDNITQAEVVESLQNLRITRVVIAHRLSTIREADRIIVLDAGRVVQEGTYDELYAAPGHFRELALRQQA
jgi:ABC-type bacteriocin/lantibiotic exporter with double-glycine peptidase domain